MKSRRSARRSPGNRSAALSPWHLIALGLVALLGTGILAAVDRSSERAGSLHAEVRAPQPKSNAPAVAKAPEAAPPAVAASPAPVPLAASQAPVPPARNPTVSVPAIELPVAKPSPPVMATAPAPLPMVVTSPAEQTPPTSGDPAATASLAPPAPPARPPVSVAPQETGPRGSVKTNATASTDCLPPELRGVLADVAARFGEVTVVSTHQLNTGNHSAGSTREKLHHDCKAVDIRADRSRIDEIKAYLRTRREIGGVESYRNGVVHMDVSGTAVASRRTQGRPAPTQTAEQTAPADALQAPSAQPEPPPPSLFTPVVPERYR
jgi:hypothetical protein